MDDAMQEFIDIIVNIIIGLVLIWSFISKFRKKSSPESDDESAQPKRFKQVIGEIINDLYETDSAKTALTIDYKGWDQIISEKSLPKPVLNTSETVKVPPPLLSEKIETEKHTDEKKEPDSETKRAFPKERAFSLKKAVIWSEILAPPLGLRD